MNMIQDGPMPTGADKPLRITGDAYKVQVGGYDARRHSWGEPCEYQVKVQGSQLPVHFRLRPHSVISFQSSPQLT